MSILFADIVRLIEVLIWPIIILFFLIRYKDSIKEFAKQALPRIRKLSIFNMLDLELQPIAELKTSWMGPIVNIQQLAHSQIFDSTETSVLSELKAPSASDCAIIDLGKGHEWLTSRLFLFSFLLKYLRNLRCFVFVCSEGYEKKYIGNAKPEAVQDALVRTFPEYANQLDLTLMGPPHDTSMYKIRAKVRNLPEDDPSISQLINGFLNNIRSPQPPLGLDPKWVLLGNVYENASWITEHDIKAILGKELNESRVIDDEEKNKDAHATCERLTTF